MGMFDDLLRIADKGMKAVENGALEQKLSSGLDKIESGLGKAIDSAEKAADAPEKLLKAAEDKHDQISQAAQNASKQAGKVIDKFQK
jgi:hypothetical protein